ncbi:MAG: flagellar assembly protein A [Candidatus Latescibacterota bacterium]
MTEQDPAGPTRDSAEPGGSDPSPGESRGSSLSGELDSLLAQEGVERSEAEGTEDPGSEEAGAAGGERAAPSGSRQARQERWRRDLHDLRSLDTLLASGPMEVVVSQDRLTAHLSRVDPAARVEDLRVLLGREGIVHGVDEAALQEAVARAARGVPVRGVLVARGTPVSVLQAPGIRYQLDLPAHAHDFARLHALLQDAPGAEAFHVWGGSACAVSPGDTLAELVPPIVRPGRDVHGQPIQPPAQEAAALWGGDNTSWTEDGTCCRAAVHGYAGILDGEPAVVPPLWVAPDRMEVRFVNLRSGRTPPDPPTPAQVRHLLEQQGVTHGILGDQIERLCARLAQGRPVPVTFTLACGRPAVPGQDAVVQLAWGDAPLLDEPQLRHLLGPRSVEATQAMLQEAVRLAGGQPLCLAVRPGEVLAEKLPVTEGAAGLDVEGHELVPGQGEDRTLGAGDNVRLTEDGLRSLATCFGCACLRMGHVHVVPPVWIAPDRMTAYYVNLPQVARPRYPSLEEIYGLLDRAGVRHGFSGEEWPALAEALESGRITDLLVPLARGTPAEPGQDAVFEWAIDIETRRAGRVLADGSIDFRERHLTTAVEAGALIGTLLPGREGTPGTDVLGAPVLPLRPLSIEVLTDSRIGVREEDGRRLFHAEAAGGVVHQAEASRGRQRVRRRLRIGISPTTSIEGDVDYSTGNIDFHGDVVISGSVQSLFSVKASGDVSIGGYVEAGAFVSTGRDILVKGGVVGANTELVAGGSVMAKYIQEATIRAARDVQAGAYLYNASVRAGGRVSVVGKGDVKLRALVGGLVWAGEGIEAASVGSPYSSSTRLVAGVDPDSVTRVDQLRSNLAACEERRRHLMEKVGLDSLDLELVRQRLRRVATSEQRKAVVAGLRRLARIAALAESLRQELEELSEVQRQLARRATIVVRHRLHAGVEVRLGEATLLVQNDYDRVRLQLVGDNGQERIEVGPLRA